MQIHDNDLRYQQIQNQMMNMPQWAKAKHMEMSVPEKELWRYSGDAMCPSQKHRRQRSVLLTLPMTAPAAAGFVRTAALGRAANTFLWTTIL